MMVGTQDKPKQKSMFFTVPLYSHLPQNIFFHSLILMYMALQFTFN